MISLSGLSKYYYSAGAVAAGLRKINLEFAAGEFVVITGESGSGKSTLLNVISGLIPYEEGEMYVDGEPTSHYDADDWENYSRDRIGFVFQDYRLIGSYTAAENVISALLLRGYTRAEAEEACTGYLEKTGIAKLRDQKASRLSSGQKQRLAIARALAKETGIIVADEPTGNLDPENGREVMKLFSELAQERLIIVVTHNYEQAEPFATRKIVIHDAEVAEDIRLCSKTPKNARANTGSSEKEKHKSSTERTRIRSFLRMNLKAQPGRAFFFTVFLFLTMCASYIFFGSFLENLDDISAKQYSSTYFYNNSPLRIVVRRPDGMDFAGEDLAVLSEISHVKELDPYDLANDMYYFCEDGKDYITTYTASSGTHDELLYHTDIYLKEYTKFVRSAASLKEEDLASGALPEGPNDVVVYAPDETAVGSTKVYYFCNRRDWQTNSYIRMELKVCGILKEPVSQAYFSDETVRALSLGALGEQSFIEQRADLYKLQNKLVIGAKTMPTAVFYTDDTLGLSQSSPEIALTEKTKANYAGFNAAVLFTIVHKGGEIQSYEEQDCAIAEVTHNSSDMMAALSNEAFHALTDSYESAQASLYLNDYAYMDQTLAAIRNAGYEAVSPYRASMRVYDTKLARQRLTALAVSFGALAAVFGLQLIVAKSLLRLKDKDYLILRAIGMGRRMPGRIQRREVFWCAAAAVLLTISAAAAASWIGENRITQLARYYRPAQTAVFLIIQLAAACGIAAGYGRHLEKKRKAGTGGGGSV